MSLIKKFLGSKQYKEQKSEDVGKKIRILAVDGGGLKGMFTVYAIWRLKEEYGINLVEEFDMFTGTSTGAIVVGSLLIGKDPKEIYDEYMRGEKDLFGKKYTLRESMSKNIYARYDDEPLNRTLKETLGNLTIADFEKVSPKPFAIAATNVSEAKPIIFGSSHFHSLNPRYSSSIKLWEAIKASTAAPFYFEPHVEQETGAFWLDGGMWANNPALLGVVLAQGDLGIELKNITVLSFGQSFIEGVSVHPRKGRELLKNPSQNTVGLLAYASLYANQNFDTFAVSLLLKERHFRYSPREQNEHAKIDSIDDEYLKYCQKNWEVNKEKLVKFIQTGKNSNYNLGDTKRYN